MKNEQKKSEELGSVDSGNLESVKEFNLDEVPTSSSTLEEALNEFSEDPALGTDLDAVSDDEPPCRPLSPSEVEGLANGIEPMRPKEPTFEDAKSTVDSLNDGGPSPFGKLLAYGTGMTIDEAIKAKHEATSFTPGSFSWAWDYLQKGFAVRLPSWKGYWKFSNERQTIEMHTKDGAIIDIRDTQDVSYTVGAMASNEWTIAEDVDYVELNVVEFMLSDALRFIRQDIPMESPTGLIVFQKKGCVIPVEKAYHLASMSGRSVQVALGKAGRIEFADELQAVYPDGKIHPYVIAGADITEAKWTKAYLTHDELLRHNELFKSSGSADGQQ